MGKHTFRKRAKRRTLKKIPGLKTVNINNILKIEYLKETYLEYLKERLIKIKKNEKFKEISNIIINNVPEDNGELLKEFIRKRVEYKFGSANG